MSCACRLYQRENILVSLLLNLDLDYPVFTSLFILKTSVYLFKEKGNEGQFSNAKSQPRLFC